jgi:hypothetical protein
MSEQWQHDFALAYVNGRDITNKESLIDIPPLNLSNKIQFSKREWYDMKLELKAKSYCVRISSFLIPQIFNDKYLVNNNPPQ